MKGAEYWVMRIVVAEGAALADADAWRALQLAGKAGKLAEVDRMAILRGIARGELFVIGSDICQPIEVYDCQERANSRAIREHQKTGTVHKIVLNAEL